MDSYKELKSAAWTNEKKKKKKKHAEHQMKPERRWVGVMAEEATREGAEERQIELGSNNL